MNAKSMEKHKENKWYEFWSNLKEGYDFFENNNKLPPNVKVLSGKYVFESELFVLAFRPSFTIGAL
jgi:murein L,D-transpeptidase YafK